MIIPNQVSTGDDREKKFGLDETLDMSALKPGTITGLPERYETMSELGRGGMGIVYKARDRETGEILAIKILKPEIAVEAQVLERFKNELRLAHKITHRNVARLYEFHRNGETVFVSMEFVEGESLRAFLLRSGKLDPERALAIARQIVSGLGEAHRQSIVHRDLKPENIMMAESGEIKVMDFGISRSYAAGVTATGAIIGTPAYMAPEQAEGKSTDQRTDVYAFGLILYEMFTGKAAFSGETPVSVALKQVRERPPAPSTVAPGLPKNIEAAILKCLEKDPANRFQSIEEVERALEGAPARTVPSRTSKLPRRWLLAAIPIVAAAIVGTWWWTSRPSDSLRFPVEHYTLKNGLPVILSVDHGAPVFTLTVAYKAGIRRDPPERAGLALTAAHLMQQGSANVAPDEDQGLVEGVGGDHVYGIQEDFSYFSSTLPANQLDLALFLEADRMRSLQITQTGLDAARSYVFEQIAGQANRPYARALDRMVEMCFSDPADRRRVWGSVEALNRVTVDEAVNFYKTYYVPSNAVLILAGDFDPKKAHAAIERQFADVPSRPVPPLVTHEDPRTSETRERMEDPSAHVPVIAFGYQVPPLTESEDWFALKSLMHLLTRGPASRLRSSLVLGAGVATEIEGELSTAATPNIFWFVVVAVPGKDLGQVEHLALEEVDRIGREGVPATDLERLRSEMLMARATELVPTAARTLPLAELTFAGLPPESLNDWETNLRKLSSERLQQVVKKYLSPANRSVLVVAPGGMRGTIP
jgi:serine/threonine protein kinase